MRLWWLDLVISAHGSLWFELGRSLALPFSVFVAAKTTSARPSFREGGAGVRER